MDARVHTYTAMALGRGSVASKGKGIAITGRGGPRGMWMQGSIYSQPRH